jgi:hypothetical protein
MDGTNGLKEAAPMTAPAAPVASNTPIGSNTLSVNVFTAPGKAMVGERPKPFGEALGFVDVDLRGVRRGVGGHNADGG